MTQPEQDSRGFDTSRPVASFFEVVRDVLIRPARFFAGLGAPGADEVYPPLIFAVICGVVSAPLPALTAPLDPLAPEGPGSVQRFISLLQDSTAAAVALAVLAVVLLPLFAILGVYIGALIQHLFVLVFVRQRRGFWATFPVIAYGGGAVSLLTWLPLLGYVAGLYGVYVAAVGLRELHDTTTTRALLAAVVPLVLLGLLLGVGPPVLS